MRWAARIPWRELQGLRAAHSFGGMWFGGLPIAQRAEPSGGHGYTDALWSSPISSHTITPTQIAASKSFA
jgi:hypothetical protein